MAHVCLNNCPNATTATPQVLHNIDLDIAHGELVVLVGPSGCGKSTLAAHVVRPGKHQQRQLSIGDEVVNDLPPAERGIAMVFQSYALYPHMNVYRNMAFGLKIAGASKADIDQRVRHAAAILQIDHLLERLPRELSGGQRQRVAIGRAIVREPRLFLFDEPLSNLDAALRVQTRLEIAKLHRQLDATMVYVTHDQVEAMTLGDKIVVLHGGHIQQAGTPLDAVPAAGQPLRGRLHRLADDEFLRRQGRRRAGRWRVRGAGQRPGSHGPRRSGRPAAGRRRHGGPAGRTHPGKRRRQRPVSRASSASWNTWAKPTSFTWRWTTARNW